MTLGQSIISIIEKRRKKRPQLLSGPIGDFFRSGGNRLLYDVPVSSNDLVIDGGGFSGEWASNMLIAYGCRVHIFEPVPRCAERLEERFKRNERVLVFKSALGNENRRQLISILSDSSTLFSARSNCPQVEVDVIDTVEYLKLLDDATIGCFKLNIEGGEYDVIESILERDMARRLRSILVQFHRQPRGWQDRYERISSSLKKTHTRQWC